MRKVTASLALGLALAPSWQGQVAWRQACIDSCVSQSQPPTDPELERQEIVSLEREAARAIQLNSGTFFRRIYSDDFAGTLSRGEQVNKEQWIRLIESASVKYESFVASDIKVRFFQNTAVATCLWSSRLIIKDQHISSQIRAIHVYINTPNGWHAVSGQATNLPPHVQQPL